MIRTMRTLPALVFSFCVSHAQAVCPSAHFEPTLDFGSAFGAPVSLSMTHPSELWFLNNDATQVFVYFEYQTPELGFSPVYSISLWRRESDGEGLLVLRRLQGENLVVGQTKISAAEVKEVLSTLTPILQNTRYATQGCSSHFLDGYLVQMGVASSTARAYGDLIGGQAYSPDPKSDAGKAVAIARSLKMRVLSSSTNNGSSTGTK